jgi:hypothetical protein
MKEKNCVLISTRTGTLFLHFIDPWYQNRDPCSGSGSTKVIKSGSKTLSD